ncbi:MAG: hypothetical protein ACRDHC_12110 [Actinomycetota bacterium]
MERSWLRTALIVALLLLVVLLGVPIAMGSMAVPAPCPQCDSTAAHPLLFGCAAVLAFLLLFVSAGTGRRPVGLLLRPRQTYASILEHPPRSS